MAQYPWVAMVFDNDQIDVEELPKLGDVVFKKLHPNFLKSRWLGDGVFLAGVCVAVAIASMTSPGPGPFIGLAAALVVTPIVAVLQSFDIKRRGYALRTHDFTFRRGVIITKVSTIPYARIQNVKIDRGPIERLFGLATLRMNSAGGTVVVAGLPHAEATQLRSFVVDRSGILADKEMDIERTEPQTSLDASALDWPTEQPPTEPFTGLPSVPPAGLAQPSAQTYEDEASQRYDRD